MWIRPARRYCCEQLKKIGLLSSYDEIGKYMWHGGAHHVGYDVHDVVDALASLSRRTWSSALISAFTPKSSASASVWRITALVTPTGAENLSASVPRTIEDIEAVMAK